MIGNNFWRSVFNRFVACALIAALFIPADAHAARKKKRVKARSAVSAVSAVLVDTENNAYLYSKNIDRRVFPASTTKVLTAILALENLKLDDYVAASAKAVNVQQTKLSLNPGEQMKVRDLIYAILLKSANDAANVLAEAVAGNQGDFTAMMNARAAKIGAVNTRFANASGLPSSAEQYTTARDMMLILKEALKNPFFRKVITFKSRILYSKEGRRFYLKSHNKALFLNWKQNIYGKTGYTREAKSCFVGYFTKNNRQYIVAVFGCRKRWEDIKYIVERYAKVDL